MGDCFLDLEVDVNGEEVFVVNKVKILAFLNLDFLFFFCFCLWKNGCFYFEVPVQNPNYLAFCLNDFCCFLGFLSLFWFM